MDKRFHYLEPIGGVTGVNIHSLCTTDKLTHVLQDGYFHQKFPGRKLRRHDRVMVTASALAPKPELAWLIVESADEKGTVTVSVLSGAPL